MESNKNDILSSTSSCGGNVLIPLCRSKKEWEYGKLFTGKFESIMFIKNGGIENLIIL